MIDEHSELVTTGDTPSKKKYGSRLSNGEMRFVYKTMRDTYNKLLKDARTDHPTNASEVAREDMIDYLKNKWMGKGAVNMTAQTRLGASYGLLQTTYGRAARKMGFPMVDPTSTVCPEDLNDIDTNLSYCIPYIARVIDGVTGFPTRITSGNWELGLEETFKEHIWQPWNPYEPGYGADVLSRAGSYPPKSK
jgi:hypothetical protein